ncbi:MAG: MoaD/ThiS family protein [Armatimonadota bacterium]
MKVHIRYFAVLRDRSGVSGETIETRTQSVRELVDELIVSRGLGLPSSLIRIALNESFVEDQVLICDGDEITLIPPVSGG